MCSARLCGLHAAKERYPPAGACGCANHKPFQEGAELLSMTFGPKPGYPKLHILDSTDPAR